MNGTCCGQTWAHHSATFRPPSDRSMLVPGAGSRLSSWKKPSGENPESPRQAPDPEPPGDPSGRQMCPRDVISHTYGPIVPSATVYGSLALSPERHMPWGRKAEMRMFHLSDQTRPWAHWDHPHLPQPHSQVGGAWGKASPLYKGIASSSRTSAVSYICGASLSHYPQHHLPTSGLLLRKLRQGYSLDKIY